MNREQYLKCRNTNSIEPIYEYYMEKCKDNCLGFREFVETFKMWPGANDAFRSVMEEYDSKFEITALQDLRTGRVIKYY